MAEDDHIWNIPSLKYYNEAKKYQREPKWDLRMAACIRWHVGIILQRNPRLLLGVDAFSEIASTEEFEQQIFRVLLERFHQSDIAAVKETYRR